MSIVYLHRKKDTNDVFYVGIGKSLKRAYTKNRRSELWNYTYKKHGLIVEITHTDLIWEECCKIEQYLIEFYRNFYGGKLCNLTDGGDGILGFKFSKEAKEDRNKKISQSFTEERKKYYSEIFSGSKNNFFGKKHSFEARQKISKNQNPRKFLTESHKRKISEANRGENCYYYGKLGKDHPLSKAIYQCDEDGNIIKEFSSIQDAKRELKIKHIVCCLKGRRKKAGGFTWKYK